jgi:hypothetical protein
LTSRAEIPYYLEPRKCRQTKEIEMLYETDSADLLDFAKRWASLGDSVAEQVAQVVDDARAAAGLGSADQEVNPNAIKLARERLQGLNEELDQAFEDYFALLAEARS